MQLVHTILKDLERKRITPDQLGDRIIFMSMFNDIELEKRGNEDSCALTSRALRDYSSRFKDGQWAFLDQVKKTKGAKTMMANGTFVLRRW